MSPTLLTTRLTALIECNVVRRTALPPPVNAQVYELTEIGREIQPAIRELIRWGGRFLFPPVPGDTFEPDWVLLGLDGEQAARLLGISPTACSTRLHRALQKLEENVRRSEDVVA